MALRVRRQRRIGSPTQQHDFGNTCPKVSALGFGAGQIGAESLDEPSAGAPPISVLDCGITLIDTARGHGLSEQHIGRHLARRRSEFVLATKVRYGIAGHADGTPGSIAAAIDAARSRSASVPTRPGYAVPLRVPPPWRICATTSPSSMLAPCRQMRSSKSAGDCAGSAHVGLVRFDGRPWRVAPRSALIQRSSERSRTNGR